MRTTRGTLRYDEYLAAGYPIASGVAEGACKHLVKDRMEPPGCDGSWKERKQSCPSALSTSTVCGINSSPTVLRENRRVYMAKMPNMQRLHKAVCELLPPGKLAKCVI